MHPSEAELVLLVEEKATEAQASRIRAHLAECAECSEQVAFLMRLPAVLSDETAPGLNPESLEKARGLVGKNRITGLFWWISERPVRLVIAAIVAAVGVSIPFLFEPAQPSRFRAVTESATGLQLVPEDGTLLDDSPVALLWTRVPHSIGYRLIVYGEAGTLLWQGTLTDTFAVIPSSVEFERGKNYFWTVEALLPDRTVYRSKLHAFRYSSP